MNYTHHVFFTEVRGTGTYTRVRVDIENDPEPLVFSTDIPGIAPDAGEVLTQAINDAVAQRVAERTGARQSAEALQDLSGTADIAQVKSEIEQQISSTIEPLGLTATVELLNPPPLSETEQMALLEQQVSDLEDQITILSEQVG